VLAANGGNGQWSAKKCRRVYRLGKIELSDSMAELFWKHAEALKHDGTQHGAGYRKGVKL